MQNSEKEIFVSDSIFYDSDTGSSGNNFSDSFFSDPYEISGHNFSDSIFSDPDEISGHNFSDSSRFNSSSGLKNESFLSKVKFIKFVVDRETKYFKNTYKHKQVFFNLQTLKRLINKFLRTWYWRIHRAYNVNEASQLNNKNCLGSFQVLWNKNCNT